MKKKGERVGKGVNKCLAPKLGEWRVFKWMANKRVMACYNSYIRSRSGNGVFKTKIFKEKSWKLKKIGNSGGVGSHQNIFCDEGSDIFWSKAI